MKVSKKQCYYFSFRQCLYIPDKYRIYHLPASTSCVTRLYMCVTLCRFPTLFSFTWFTYIDIHSVNLYHLMEEIKLHWWKYQYLLIYGLYIHYLFMISINIIWSWSPLVQLSTNILHTLPHPSWYSLFKSKNKSKKLKIKINNPKIRQKEKKRKKFHKTTENKTWNIFVLLNYSWA